MHLKMLRDGDGRPVDALNVHGYVERAEISQLEQASWDELDLDLPLPGELGTRGKAAAASRWPSRSCCCCGTC